MASADRQLASRQKYTVHIGVSDEAVLNTFSLAFNLYSSPVKSLSARVQGRDTRSTSQSTEVFWQRPISRGRLEKYEATRSKTRHSVPHRNLRVAGSISLEEELWADTP